MAIEFVSHASSSAGNLYEVRDGDARLVIEAGVTWSQMQVALAHRVVGLDGILVSHSHGDHSRCALQALRRGAAVYATAETHAAIAGRQSVGGLRAVTMSPLQTYTVGEWRILAWPTVHDCPGAVGFLVEGPSGDRLLYAVDTAYVPYRFPGLTHIACECNWVEGRLFDSEQPPIHVARVLRTHMGLERLLSMLRANELGRVREIHLLHLSDGHSDAEQIRRRVSETTGKPTYIAPKRRVEDA